MSAVGNTNGLKSKNHGRTCFPPWFFAVYYLLGPGYHRLVSNYHRPKSGYHRYAISITRTTSPSFHRKRAKSSAICKFGKMASPWPFNFAKSLGMKRALI